MRDVSHRRREAGREVELLDTAIEKPETPIEA